MLSDLEYSQLLTASDGEFFSCGIVLAHEAHVPAVQAGRVCVKTKVHDNGYEYVKCIPVSPESS